MYKRQTLGRAFRSAANIDRLNSLILTRVGIGTDEVILDYITFFNAHAFIMEGPQVLQTTSVQKTTSLIHAHDNPPKSSCEGGENGD